MPVITPLLFGRQRQKMTPPPFTANATFTVPFTTSILESLVGKGQDGSTTPDEEVTTYTITTTTISFKRTGGQDVSANTDPTIHYGTPPGSYCDPLVPTPDSPTYTATQTCYDFNASTEIVPGSSTNGANTTGFGKTFAGGVGTNATPVTYNNVPLTSGATYNLVVPAGGYITITYYQ